MPGLKVGEMASVINDSVKGVIKSISADIVLLEDEHGLQWEYRMSELVSYKDHDSYKLNDVALSKEIDQKIKDQIFEKKHQLRSNEIDLHIEELLDDHRNMTNHEILTKQMAVCKQFVQMAIEKGMNKIVLIHGKGEGVLKAEIHSYLNKLRYYNEVHLEYHDASFSEYGFGGATEVVFN
ncbi:MAG: Smr/MutS family protein [Crocinitomicaceae bacterium]